jgi:hypothetical protein
MRICECGTTAWVTFGNWTAMVDAADAPLLAMGWCIQTRNKGRDPSCLAKTIDGRTTRLHRLILKPEPCSLVDHINGNPLDNRRSNLRLADEFGNSRNRRVSRGVYTGFKGVHSHRLGWWRAVIIADGKKHDLGVFRSPVEAAKAYDAAAVELHGQFARTNEKMGLLRSDMWR